MTFLREPVWVTKNAFEQRWSELCNTIISMIPDVKQSNGPLTTTIINFVLFV